MNSIIGKRKPALSARMRQIVAMLQQEAQTEGVIPCMLDIGCDHALISIACVLEGIAEHVIAMDVREQPITLAQSNIQLYSLEKSVETRISDGFEQAEIGEAAWAVIAGMGGETMSGILRRGKPCLEAGIGLLLQPQSELETVRNLLCKEGYEIVDEAFLLEDGKFYTIIKAKKGKKMTLTSAQARYGPVLIQRMEPLFSSYLQQEKEKKETLLCALSEKDTQSARLRCESLRQELAILSDAGRR